MSLSVVTAALKLLAALGQFPMTANTGRREAGRQSAVAAAGGQLIVVYGCAIGVRPAAPGKPFPAAARRGELARSQTDNLAAWGLAGWR